MRFKTVFSTVSVFFVVVAFFWPRAGFANNDETGGHEHHLREVPGGMAHEHMDQAGDKRKSLNLSPMMKVHQLANMRIHLKAVREIVADMGTGEYEKASAAAHEKLGLTPMMKQMCDVMPAGFREKALAFHRSGDELGDVLLTKDPVKSLKALDATLSHCTACHETYRQ